MKQCFFSRLDGEKFWALNDFTITENVAMVSIVIVMIPTFFKWVT